VATIRVEVYVETDRGARLPWAWLSWKVQGMTEAEIKRAMAQRRGEGPRPAGQEHAPGVSVPMADLRDAVARDVLRYVGQP